MTSIDTVRHAADVTKDSVRHAAEAAAPYANTARDGAVRYGRQYGRQAGAMAKEQYDARLAPVVGQAAEQAWAAVPPKAVTAVETAARRTRDGAKVAAGYTAPKVGAAMAATMAVAAPARDEIAMRGGAALRALRGHVTAAQIEKMAEREMRRRQNGRLMRRLMVAGLAGAAAFAAFKWWSGQSNPDWLADPSEDAEDDAIGPGSTLTVVDPMDEPPGSVNGSAPTVDHADGSPETGPEPQAGSGPADTDADADRRGKDDDH